MNALMGKVYRGSGLFDAVHYVRLRRGMWQWEKRGKPTKVPHLVKQRAVREYAGLFGCAVLVETGTLLGDMVYACRHAFREIHSIELDEALHRRARERFGRYSQVRLHHGDSAEVLPRVIGGLSEPILFWLDAHYSGGMTARGSVDTPIAEELQAIFKHQDGRHVVLIDDAHEFVGENGYPTMDDLRAFVEALRPDLFVEVFDNIIRISPNLRVGGRP